MELDPLATYSVYMDIVPVDDNKYKYRGKWTVAGKAKETEEGSKYFHPDSPKPGEYWMKHMTSFCRVKLTNHKKTRPSQVRKRPSYRQRYMDGVI